MSPDLKEEYTDAHYEPVEESTVPPRYYTPHVRAEKDRKKQGGDVSHSPAVLIILLLLGMIAGSVLTGIYFNRRLSSLEASLLDMEKAEAEAADAALSAATAAGEAESETGLTPAEIYRLATQQVVGIRTEFTVTNFFGMTSSGAVSASGFVVSPDGYILTNYHVIEDAHLRNLNVDVVFYDGAKYSASIIGIEPANDLAVLKIEAEGLSAAVIGNSDTLEVGDPIYAIGNPLGELEFSMSTGYVSALDRVISTDEGESINMFQLDAAVNEGNSGGPVYSRTGEVIGIVTAKYASTGVEGLGFAIPSNDASEIASDLITKGYVSGKAALGVTVNNDYTAMYAQYYGMPLGAYVDSVISGSAAEAAGMRASDIIISIDDTVIQNYNDLRKCLRLYRANDKAMITVYRSGEEIQLPITFDEAKPS